MEHEGRRSVRRRHQAHRGREATPRGRTTAPVLARLLDPGDPAPHAVSLADGAGRVRLLHVVNSLDTPVCHLGAHRFERIAATLPQNVDVYTVSMDLPFAQLRWRASEGVSHGALSSHRSEDLVATMGCCFGSGASSSGRCSSSTVVAA